MKRPIFLLLVLVIVVASIFVAPNILLGGAKVITLNPAPTLSGQISQAIATSTSSVLSVIGKDYTLQDTKYFDSDAWVVTRVVPISNNFNEATVVLKGQGDTYVVVLGPGSSFPKQAAKDLPADVAQYLNLKGVLYAL